MIQLTHHNDSTVSSLTLSRQKIGCRELENICDIIHSNVSSITSLIFKGNRLGAEGARTIGFALSCCSALTYLQLSDNKITDQGLMYISQSLSHSTSPLTSLDLSNNYITYRCMNEIRSLILEKPSLTHLNLQWNMLGDEGAAALSQTLAQTQSALTSLVLACNNIGPKGASHLHRAVRSNYTLLSLSLAQNNINKQTKDHINKTISQNQQQVRRCRSQFLRSVIIVLRDNSNPHSNSTLSLLPTEIVLYILSLSGDKVLMGKSREQMHQCASFIFRNKDSLDQLLKSSNTLRIVEKVIKGSRSEFSFANFLSVSAQSST